MSGETKAISRPRFYHAIHEGPVYTRNPKEDEWIPQGGHLSKSELRLTNLSGNQEVEILPICEIRSVDDVFVDDLVLALHFPSSSSTSKGPIPSPFLIRCESKESAQLWKEKIAQTIKNSRPNVPSGPNRSSSFPEVNVVAKQLEPSSRTKSTPEKKYRSPTKKKPSSTTLQPPVEKHEHESSDEKDQQTADKSEKPKNRPRGASPRKTILKNPAEDPASPSRSAKTVDGSTLRSEHHHKKHQEEWRRFDSSLNKHQQQIDEFKQAQETLIDIIQQLQKDQRKYRSLLKSCQRDLNSSNNRIGDLESEIRTLTPILTNLPLATALKADADLVEQQLSLGIQTPPSPSPPSSPTNGTQRVVMPTSLVPAPQPVPITPVSPMARVAPPRFNVDDASKLNLDEEKSLPPKPAAHQASSSPVLAVPKPQPVRPSQTMGTPPARSNIPTPSPISPATAIWNRNQLRAEIMDNDMALRSTVAQLIPAVKTKTTTQEFIPYLTLIKEIFEDFSVIDPLIDTPPRPFDTKGQHKALARELILTRLQDICNITFRLSLWADKTQIDQNLAQVNLVISSVKSKLLDALMIENL